MDLKSLAGMDTKRDHDMSFSLGNEGPSIQCVAAGGACLSHCMCESRPSMPPQPPVSFFFVISALQFPRIFVSDLFSLHDKPCHTVPASPFFRKGLSSVTTEQRLTGYKKVVCYLTR